MLLIRDEQMEAFRNAALVAFEQEMLRHLSQFSPPLFKAVKAEQMRQVIRFGMSRARREYGLTFRGPVRLYLELMLLFGSHFDTDLQYPWASVILNDKDNGDQMQRAEQLYHKTLEYREKVGGPQDAYTLKALSALRSLARRPLPVGMDNFHYGMLEQMDRVYPQKTEYIGRPVLERFIDRGIDSARRYGFLTVREQALVVVLAFAFGHGCLDDPLYPWISGTIRGRAGADPAKKAERLEKKALTWLDHVLAYFEKGVPA